jgi:Zn-dependent protease
MVGLVSPLSFRLGKIPVRVAPSFFVMALIFGAYGLLTPGGTGLSLMLAWVVIVFASVLLHELGHATTGMLFGLEPRIELHGMGGTTSWAASRPLSVPRRILVSLAGPGAGFVVAAIVRYGLGRRVFPDTLLGAYAYENLLYVNFYWGVANLAPMLPLDGGQVMTQVLNALTGGRGERPARYVSIAVAAIAAPTAFVLLSGSVWAALLCVSFIGVNVSALRDLTSREHDEPMRRDLEAGYAALQARDGTRLLELARPIALSAQTPQVRAEALQLVAFGFVLEGRAADADAAIAAMPPGFQVHPSLTEMRSRLTS